MRPTFKDSEFWDLSRGCAEKRSGWTLRTIARTCRLSGSSMHRRQGVSCKNSFFPGDSDLNHETALSTAHVASGLFLQVMQARCGTAAVFRAL